MPISQLDPVAALVVIDLHKGVLDSDPASHQHAVAVQLKKSGETATTDEVLAALRQR
jgi:hypothetical protein